MSSSETVIREVTKDVWTFSRPFARFGIIPIGGRSTAIKLSSGDVWVLASTPLNDVTKAKIDELGPVKYIVGGDAVHHLFLGEFKRNYPTAKLIAPEEAIQKKVEEGLTFDGSWGKDPVGTQYGFENDIQHCFFPGFQNKEVVFYHSASKSLIEADLLFNLPPKEQYSKSSSSGYVPFVGNLLQPWHILHKKFAWSLGTDKEAMRRDVRTVASWDFTRVIPCHGDVIEDKGKEAFMEAYKYYFD
ncbi:hypothetical protein PHLGIDRAFT_130737 [Phlebiopsis gigantea 11061_1 CR5-6]|uniref:Metallo-beta-lactamase domain-containing protein n=1 Tax=Phlebiopsis gigantea (strain 11061_1 CR5-6) TaxID=745531 RepID=A0A0C3PBR2_PHLG1|nr:hypothetical protein PHLGIDRAFT_130737 [Phlebiopsis gigantea 11061_1 CR5-6]